MGETKRNDRIGFSLSPFLLISLSPCVSRVSVPSVASKVDRTGRARLRAGGRFGRREFVDAARLSHKIHFSRIVLTKRHHG